MGTADGTCSKCDSPLDGSHASYCKACFAAYMKARYQKRDRPPGRPAQVLYEVDPDTGCWLWRSSLSWSGYARIHRDGRLQWAHRWYYQQAGNTIPDGMDLDHLCRVKSCVNPDHLEPVTKAENQRRGNAVRLTWDQVEYIRDHYIPYDREFGARALAQRFGVNHGTVQKVVHGRSWVDEPALSRR